MTQNTVPVVGKDEVFEEELLAAVTGQSLHLIVLPTEQCNFRCTYCYEDFEIGRMAPDTVQSVKRLVGRRLDGLQRLHVSWFGGEPLVARTVVEDISSFIVDAVTGRPEVQYAADMTTNGYLLDAARAEGLARLGINSYQISLDGPQEVHDTTRLRADGGGSFQRIWQNLLSVRRSDLEIRVLLRLHLTPSNLPFMREFVSDVRDTFLGDSRFSVRLKAIERMGGPNDEEIEVLGRETRAQVLEELGSLVRTGSASRNGTPREEACYAARPNSLVVRADGTIAKCTVALNDPRNTVGRIMSDGTLRIDGARVSPWVRGWAAQDWAAVRCPYAGMPRPGQELLQLGPPRLAGAPR
ncbi:radical SAM protein [Streptomyces decoyicus]|uniref:radical SAM protein n=1 Tax=Streptomyces decoyicus TaxID=249567 RepID=UPI003635F24B